MRYTPWIVSEHVPDFSTLPNIFKHRRFAGKKDEDFAVALWDLFVDRELGIFHYCPAQEPLWQRDAQDPLLIFNVFGFTICHVHAHVMAMLAQAAGYDARIANISGHEGTEISYGGKWHYFDADVQYFHRKREAPYEIASRDDLHKDPTLVDDQPRPSNPYGFPDRLPEKFRRLYESDPDYPELLPEMIHAMDYRLRPGEELMRYFHHRGRWHVFPNHPAMFLRFRSETGPEGPTERFWPRRQWGNGYFHYAPRLAPGYRDAELGADELHGLTLGEKGLTVEGLKGRAVFAFESPYLYCGIPDPMKRVPSVDGAKLKVAFDLPSGGWARIEAAVYRPGHAEEWQTIWRSDGKTGDVAADLDFTDLVDGTFRCKLRFDLDGTGSALKSLETRFWFMVSPHSLPALRTAGPNRMSLHSGDRYGLNTRELRAERVLTAPESIRACIDENLRYEPSHYSILLPKDARYPWKFTHEIQAPPGAKLAWASVYALFESRKPGESDATPCKIEIADELAGPWTTIAERPLPEHPQGWHFGMFGEGRFGLKSESGYVRFSSKKGMKGFRINAHYVPAGEVPQTPLEIEHAWYEDDPAVGRRLRKHSETTESLAHEYTVTCEQEPHDEYVRLAVPSVKE